MLQSCKQCSEPAAERNYGFCRMHREQQGHWQKTERAEGIREVDTSLCENESQLEAAQRGCGAPSPHYYVLHDRGLSCTVASWP